MVHPVAKGRHTDGMTADVSKRWFVSCLFYKRKAMGSTTLTGTA